VLTRSALRAYRDRAEAGRRLGEALESDGFGDAVVLALPRGGVEIGLHVARAIRAPLDVLIVRKLGVPWQPELALGAVASDEVLLLNQEVIDSTGVSTEEIEEIAATERRELERRETAYRAGRPRVDVRGKTVILVDDGLATGATMRAAVVAVRKRAPARVVVAVPVGAAETVRRLELDADQVVCPLVPRFLMAIGTWYEEFPQLSDDDVRRLLEEARRLPRQREGVPAGSGGAVRPS
jgi:predicted phosphoribosyltransferase